MSNEEHSTIGANVLSKEVILSLTKPVVFHGMINEWEVLKWTPEEWKNVLKDSELPFRCGLKQCSPFPQWESKCSTEEMTLEHFVNLHKNAISDVKNDGKWYYFDYKRIWDWVPEEYNEVLQSINWGKFGYPDFKAKDSTLWIGSSGAHTPCHFDTYGCNLVAQLFGTKRWILFPPSESGNLQPTRVPYEESSVYSQWNFSCPLPSNFYTGVRDVYTVDLKPGDVLFVPKHWWHYVESLDLSVSMNVWIPMESDDISRFDEAIVRLLMSQMSQQLSENEQKVLLNPNECDIPSVQLHDMTSMMVSLYMEFVSQNAEVKEPPSKRQKLQEIDHSSLLTILQKVNAEFIGHSSVETVNGLLERKCNCLSKESHQALMFEQGPCDLTFQVQGVLNAFCHPDIVMRVRKKIIENFSLHHRD